jgi:hypothetical protein
MTANLVVGVALGESRDEFRTRVAQRQAEALERRSIDLAAQTATVHPPSERIRIWERLHQISLPRDPAHRLLQVIAADTALTLEQVLEEQRQRTPSAATDKP